MVATYEESTQKFEIFVPQCKNTLKKEKQVTGQLFHLWWHTTRHEISKSNNLSNNVKCYYGFV